MLTLYEHPFALYCQKVLIALNELGVAYDGAGGAARLRPRRAGRAVAARVDPGAGRRRPGDRRDLDHHRARRRGAGSCPSLEARLWDRICDQYVSDAVQAIVADTFEERLNERATGRARGRLEMAYGMLESQLAAHEFLAGDTFTIADCAAAPGLFYALAIHPWDEAAHPQLTRYYRALAQRPSFAKVIADARPYRELFPLPWPRRFRPLPLTRRRRQRSEPRNVTLERELQQLGIYEDGSQRRALGAPGVGANARRRSRQRPALRA